NPVLAADHVVPLLEEMKTPPPAVPVKITLPFIARERMRKSVRPEFLAVQFAPLSVEMKTPRELVPAKILLPATSKAFTSPVKGPLVCTHCAFAFRIRNIKQSVEIFFIKFFLYIEISKKT